MIHIPVSCAGANPTRAWTSTRSSTSPPARSLAEVSRANAGLVERDMRHAQRARDVLREIPINDLLQMMKKAGDLYTKAELPLGDGTQTPDQFVRMQSATTGLPEHMCRFNMEKNHFVLNQWTRSSTRLTRGLDLNILSRGYGVEARGVPVSYQAQSPVLGMVLPSNSPGVHTLWLPIIPMQIGLVLKPGPQEPWTPYRMAAGVRPGGRAEAGHRHLSRPRRRRRRGAAALPAQPDLRRHRHRRAVQGQPARAGARPRLQQDPARRRQGRQLGKYLDIMVDSVCVNSGRGCINCSGIWASRHAKEIAEALAERIGPVEPLPPEDPKAALAAFTVPGQADARQRRHRQGPARKPASTT